MLTAKFLIEYYFVKWLLYLLNFLIWNIEIDTVDEFNEFLDFNKKNIFSFCILHGTGCYHV